MFEDHKGEENGVIQASKKEKYYAMMLRMNLLFLCVSAGN